MNTCTLLDVDQVISISANGDAFGIFLNPDKLVNEYNTIEQMFGIGRVNRGNLCNIKNCTKLKKKSEQNRKKLSYLLWCRISHQFLRLFDFCHVVGGDGSFLLLEWTKYVNKRLIKENLLGITMFKRMEEFIDSSIWCFGKR